MKYKVFVTYAGFLLKVMYASSFFNEAVRMMDSVPLIDGKSLLGRPIPYRLENIDIQNINQNVFLSMRVERLCDNMLKNPIKSQGWISDTYYTPDEFSSAYKELVHFSFLLNPAALCFYRDVLKYGNIYGLQIPGLKPQQERAQLFEEVYEWTADIKKQPLFLEHVQLACLNAEKEAIEESKKHQSILDSQKNSFDTCLDVDVHSKKSEPSTLRHRHTWGDSNDNATERSILLAPQILRVH